MTRKKTLHLLILSGSALQPVSLATQTRLNERCHGIFRLRQHLICAGGKPGALEHNTCLLSRTRMKPNIVKLVVYKSRYYRHYLLDCDTHPWSLPLLL